MDSKILSMIIFLIISIISITAVSAAEVPVNLEKIQVDGTDIIVYEDCLLDANNTVVCRQRNSINLLNVEKGDDMSIKLKLNAYEDSDNVQVQVDLDGYEYDDKNDLSDETHVFDVEANSTYNKRLEIEAPSKLENDNYKLRITIKNRNDDRKEYSFDLRINPSRHLLQIKDIDFTPENNIESGKMFQTSIRVKNIGKMDEESVKVRVSVPELGISSSSYLDIIESDETESSEEIWLRIPECAETGFYDVEVSAIYDEGYETVSAAEQIAVSGDKCKNEETKPALKNTKTAGGSQINQTIFSGTEDKTESLRDVLEISLIILIIALAVVGLVLGFAKLSKQKEDF